MARIVLCVVATSSSSTNSKSNTKLMSTVPVSLVESSWNVMAHDDAREGKWRGNWRMEWVASTLHTTSEHGVSSISAADAHISAASSRLNWRLRRLKWTRPFRRKTKFGFCLCAITFQKQSTCNCWQIVECLKFDTVLEGKITDWGLIGHMRRSTRLVLA